MSREKQNTPINTPTNTNLHQPCESVQVEEIVKLLCADYGEGCKDCPWENLPCSAKEQAEKLYNAGYRKQSEGEWIFKEEKDAFFCSLCDQEALIDANTIGIDFAIAELSDFCPHCGAKMKGGAE